MMAYSEYKAWLQDGSADMPGVFSSGGSISGGSISGVSTRIEERILNHWDNITGVVERGYSGGSLFFKNGDVCYDPERIRDYARMLASIGINRVCCNNVNVTERAARLITEELLPDIAGLAAIFREFGIRFIIAVDFTSPRLLGGITTYDPFDDDVIRWWENAASDVYKHIPDLAGFLVKADSEFRDGPAALGRTQADGANVIARALKPHGGKVYWRCFVYNCVQDWRDTVTDRPKAAYDHFYPLDGDFDDNVILQIKHGPSDFQVREPNSPLIGSMKHTAQAIELQVTQEYTGQQIDLYALAVQWEEIFASPVSDTRTMCDLMGNEVTAIVAVANTGLDINWTGHTLAQANLYSFGRMACDPSLTARDVLSDWIALTFGAVNGEGSGPGVGFGSEVNSGSEVCSESDFYPGSESHGKLLNMMLASRSVYEKYTTPLGLCWMVNISHHYGPSPEGYEFSKWGTYHRANHKAIGVDRTEKGTGYTAQYHPYLNDLYSNVETCPEELLLYFHRLPYDFPLKDGRTLLQYTYDTHFEGYDEVEGFIRTWDSLRSLLPECAYESVAARLQRQLANAREWRDVVNTYFYRLTGIGDEHGRFIYE